MEKLKKKPTPKRLNATVPPMADGGRVKSYERRITGVDADGIDGFPQLRQARNAVATAYGPRHEQ